MRFCAAGSKQFDDNQPDWLGRTARKWGKLQSWKPWFEKDKPPKQAYSVAARRAS